MSVKNINKNIDNVTMTFALNFLICRLLAAAIEKRRFLRSGGDLISYQNAH